MCTFNDIKHNAGFIIAPVIESHQSYPANYNSFLTFQQNMWNNYLQFGCQFFYNRIILFQSQLPSITNPYHISLKTAKIQFCQQMYIDCGC